MKEVGTFAQPVSLASPVRHLVERACRWLILAGTEWGSRWTFSNGNTWALSLFQIPPRGLCVNM